MDPDIKDKIDAAATQLRALAGRSLAKKELAQEELRRLESQLREVEATLCALGPGEDSALFAEATSIRDDLARRVDLKHEELSSAELAHRTAQEGMRDLRASAGELERETLVGKVRNLSQPDPFLPSATDRALENARNAILDLEGTAKLEDELAGGDAGRDLRRLKREDDDARMRAQLAELKAKKKGTPQSAGASSDAEPEAEPGPAKRPKRTL